MDLAPVEGLRPSLLALLYMEVDKIILKNIINLQTVTRRELVVISVHFLKELNTYAVDDRYIGCQHCAGWQGGFQ